MIRNIDLQLESHGISNFLVYKVPSEVKVDLHQVEALRFNYRCRLVPCFLFEKESGVHMRYDVISDMTVEKYMNEMLNKEQLQGLLLSMIDTFINMKEVGLRLENLLLDKRYMYMIPYSNQVVFIYLPLENHSFEKVTTLEFFREIMGCVTYDMNSDVHFFMKMHNYFAKLEKLDITACRDFLTGAESPMMEQVPEEEEVHTSVLHVTSTPEVENVDEEVEVGFITSVLNLYDNLEETNVLQSPYLMVDGQKKVEVKGESFKIGRDPRNTDFTLNHGAIGRVHATILTVNNQYFLKDNQSTNGTYVNGRRLDKGENVKIKHDDVIRLATEEMTFRVR